MAKQLKVTTLAKKLKEIREEIVELKKDALGPLEEAENDLIVQLLAELKNAGLDTVRTEGYSFIRAQKTTYKVEDPVKALEWAKQYPAVLKPASVDTAKAATILQREMELPEGFTRVDTEYLSVRKSADNE